MKNSIGEQIRSIWPKCSHCVGQKGYRVNHHTGVVKVAGMLIMIFLSTSSQSAPPSGHECWPLMDESKCTGLWKITYHKYGVIYPIHAGVGVKVIHKGGHASTAGSNRLFEVLVDGNGSVSTGTIHSAAGVGVNASHINLIGGNTGSSSSSKVLLGTVIQPLYCCK